MKEIDDVINALSTLQFLDIVKEKDSVVLINIERRDIRSRPYLFTIVYLNPKEIKVVYSLSPSLSPKKRRLEVIRFILNVLTILESVYFINHAELYQVIDNMISRLTEYASSSYDEIFSKYDAMKEEVERLRKMNNELRESNEELSKSNMELKEKINKLLLRIKELETYSDDVLMTKIQQWLMEHGYEINISDFARVYKVSEARVEQVLNKMMREGYITLRR